MGRRWLVKVKETPGGESLYLCRYKLRLDADSPLEPELRPVTLYSATRFVTKREAVALATERGYPNAVVMRTPRQAPLWLRATVAVIPAKKDGD